MIMKLCCGFKGQKGTSKKKQVRQRCTQLKCSLAKQREILNSGEMLKEICRIVEIERNPSMKMKMSERECLSYLRKFSPDNF